MIVRRPSWLDLAVQQRPQARAEAAGVDGLDVLERQIFLQPERHVEMTAGTQPDRDRDVLKILRPADPGFLAHEDRPRRDTVAIRHEAAHAGACVGDAAPNTGTLDQAFVALHVRLVLRPLEVVRALPARLRAAEGLEVPFDLDAFGGEETFLRGDEIVESHGLGGDADFAHGSSC